MANSSAKIFGIGLSKTGTTSLANALQILGYKTKDNMGVVKYAKGDIASVDLDCVETHDALTDTPIPSFYRELDTRYPGSKFILTARESEGWLMSCKKQFTDRFAKVQTDAHTRLFMDLYGTDVFDDQRFASGYSRFVDGVREYFKDRPQDLLTINVAGGEGWDQLCPFLSRAVPDVPFPKANVTQVRWMSVDDIVAVATLAGEELMQHYDGDDPSGSTFRAKKLVARVVRTVMGEDAVQAAVRAAHKVIVTGLTKLNPHIPVLSRAGILAPHAERRRWNHVWLVDPLDGEKAFASGSADFSVNIALIEDGRPIYGVVHTPATGSTYYASSAKGAFLSIQGEEPAHLTAVGAETAAVARMHARHAISEQGHELSGQALAMCARATTIERGEFTIPSSMEWQTAAAHAILSFVGLRVLGRGSERELSYNKRDLANGPVQVA